MNNAETITFAKKYLEDILASFSINIEVAAEVRDTVLELRVPQCEEASILIGRGAETLRSLQYLVSTVLRNKGAAVSRVNLDIADYKKQRAEKMAEKAREWIEKVRETGSSHVANLNAADRRIVHHVASEYDDIETFSEGEGRDRKIVIAQKSS